MTKLTYLKTVNCKSFIGMIAAYGELTRSGYKVAWPSDLSRMVLTVYQKEDKEDD